MEFDIPGLVLIANYVVLIAYFIYAYLRPGEQTEWLVVASNTYILIFVVHMFLLIFIIAGVEFVCSLLFGGFFLLTLVFILKKSIERLSGPSWHIPFVLFLAAIIQEALNLAGTEEKTLVFLWYFLGIFVLSMGIKYIGPVIDRRFPEITSLHMQEMKRVFGPKAPSKLKFKDGSVTTDIHTPGRSLIMGVLYALWMMFRHIVLP